MKLVLFKEPRSMEVCTQVQCFSSGAKRALYTFPTKDVQISQENDSSMPVKSSLKTIQNLSKNTFLLRTLYV